MTREIERRNLAQPVELRAAAAGSDSPGTLFGYAAKFGVFSQDLGGFVEQIDPAFFNKSLADEVRVLCRYNHQDMALLGTTDAGTLTLGVDDVGLFYEDVLPNTQQGRDCAVLAARGDLRYSSFAFYCFEDDWAMTPQGHPLRMLISGQLVDVAPVNSPAYLDSTAGLRSLSERINVPMSDLKTAKAEEVRARLAGDIPPGEKRALDAPDVNVITQALGWFTAVDSIVDEAQKSLAAYVGVENPDPPEENSLTDDAEQRETHSTPVSIRRRRAEWDAAAEQ
jgi:uncharacterized protein